MDELTDDISQVQPGALIRDNGLGIPGKNIEENTQEITEWTENLGLDQTGENTESGDIQTVAGGQVILHPDRPSICGKLKTCRL